MNWENRKKSEEWVKHKSEEYCKADSDLTFAEWCYEQGKADAKSDIAKECRYILNCGMGKKKSLEHLIEILEKERNE